MKQLHLALLLVFILGFSSVKLSAQDHFLKVKLLYEDNFDSVNLTDWILELQDEASIVEVKNGKLDINVPKGSTIWFKQKLKGNILIEYDAIVIDQNGPNDRVSDLNCFWMAMDARNRKDIFNSPRKPSGMFHDYDTLQLYYVGMGGHNNTKTRFRRYDGKGGKPLLPEHDLIGDKVLLEANKSYTIKLIAMGNTVQFFRDDELIYDFKDENPYKKGWFGFRTINNHMSVDNFKVYRIKKPKSK